MGPPQTVRSKDFDKDCREGVNRKRRERWGTAFVTFASFTGIASGVGFVYVYWTNSDNVVLLGGTLALCFTGLGVSLISWAHSLMSHREAIEPREAMESPPVERQLAFENFLGGKHDVHRRSLLTWMSAGFAGVFAASAVSLFRSLGTPPGPSLYDTVWKAGQRLVTLDGTPVSVDALQPGSTILVFPEGSVGDEKAQTVLIRVDEQFLHLPTQRADWAPKGYLAYSRVCTHAGCPVGLYQKETHLLVCPCHQSSFNVLQGAEPSGGPAARPLPQLPLYTDSDGMLRAGGGFSTPPGPGFWGMPA
jgi:ubiquinol-cytochrome c reductase iron-sulfur subunit